MSLVDRDVVELGAKSLDALVLTIVEAEEWSDGFDLFDLGCPNVVEVEAVVDGGRESLEELLVLRETASHFA